MDVTKTLYVTNRDDWRNWLEENYRNEREIWIVYYRKQAGKPRIPYNDAVEEALCFGWIDSIIKNIDQERYAQRFTPRKPQSKFSQTNKERLKKLIEQGKVMPEALGSLNDALVREAVQNSLDAAVGDGPVTVRFSFDVMHDRGGAFALNRYLEGIVPHLSSRHAGPPVP